MQVLSEKDRAAMNSSKLLRICTEKFSWSTVKRISEVLAPFRKNGDQHDQLVIRILDIVENSATEAEVLKKLEEL